MEVNGPVRVGDCILWHDGYYRHMTWLERFRWRFLGERLFDRNVTGRVGAA